MTQRPCIVQADKVPPIRGFPIEPDVFISDIMDAPHC